MGKISPSTHLDPSLWTTSEQQTIRLVGAFSLGLDSGPLHFQSVHTVKVYFSVLTLSALLSFCKQPFITLCLIVSFSCVFVELRSLSCLRLRSDCRQLCSPGSNGPHRAAPPRPASAEPLWGAGLISADIYGHRPICCTLRSFHALPGVLCNYPDIDEGWFQQVVAGSSAVFTHLSRMSLFITSGKLISTQWPYLLIIDNYACAKGCVCVSFRW